MLLLFFIVWIVFNGRFTWEIAIFGVVIAALMFAFVCKFMGYSWEKERALYKKTPLLCKYIFYPLRIFRRGSFLPRGFPPMRHPNRPNRQKGTILSSNLL